MPDPEVMPDTSPAPVDDQTPTTDPAPSPADGGEPEERPWKNVLAEMNRKYGKVESRLDELAAFLAAQAARATPQAATGYDALSDAQLQELDQSGSAEARIALMERIAQRQSQATRAQDTQIRQAESAVAALLQRYPQLADTSDPLRMAVDESRRQYVQMGYPAGPLVDLEAIKTAIVSNPHLVRAQSPQPASNPQRPSPAQIDGATPRRPAPRTAAAPKIDPKAIEIARRMGVKDPAKALQRFQERQAQGRSSVSPMITTIVKEG